MDLRLQTETFGGEVPFIDSAHKHLVRGGVTIDSADCLANRVESQGQVVFRDNRLVILAGSTIRQNGAGGLWQPYTPASAAVAAELLLGDADDDNDLLFTADADGAGGNDIRVGIIDPGRNNAAIDITVVGNKIEILPVTSDADPWVVTSTAAEILAAVNADGDANALVTVTNPSGDDAGVVEYVGFTNLDGGAEAVVENLTTANDVVLLWQDVDVHEANAAGGAIDHGRVLIDRLPFSDAASRAVMPGIKFVATS